MHSSSGTLPPYERTGMCFDEQRLRECPQSELLMRKSALLLLVLTTGLAVACGGDSTSPGAGPPQLRIERSTDTLNAIGKRLKLSAIIDAGGGRRTPADSLAWSSLNPTVVSIDTSGIATSRQVGQATIVARRGLLFDTLTLVSRQVLASVKAAWSAETLFVGDTISVSLLGFDSNSVAMPTTEPKLTIAGSSVSSVTGSVVRAATFGASSITASIDRLASTVSILVEGPFVSITTGNEHTCALVASGSVYCWGSNAGGAAGLGSVQITNRPQLVNGAPRLVGIDAGVNHTCGWTQQGLIYCWGAGSGTNYGATPKLVIAPEPVVAVSSGYDFSCAVSAFEIPYCWGWNQDGQSGVNPIGPGAIVTSPTRTLGPRFKSVSAGDMQACGLTDLGELFCWGDLFGVTPVRVGSPRLFRSIDTGGGACGIVTDGSVYCSTGITPQIPQATSLSRGRSYGCAVLPDASAACWGDNAYGQFGNGTSADGTQQPTTAVSGGLRFAQLSASSFWNPGEHTCGITVDGAAYCWGGNVYGEIGAPSTDACSYAFYRCNFLPTRVTRQRSGGK